MLTCIVCTKQNGSCGTRGRGVAFHDPDDDDDIAGTPITRHPIKLITSQIKDVAVKASGAYRHCRPCSGSTPNNHHRHQRYGASEKFHYSYRRAGETISAGSTPMAMCLMKEGMDSSAEATPSMSGRTTDGVNGVAGGGVVSSPEEETKEWVAQVEPGVLITLLSLPDGGNDLKRIRFSREMFSKWQAQRWWSENYDKVMELYNVQRFNHQSVPLPTTSRSEEEEESLTKMESVEPSPVTPTRRNLHRPENGGGTEHVGLATSTPKLSKAENSSSARTTISSHEDVDRSDEISISNASDQETEWVEQDEPGVYITIRALPGGVRELRRVRFSRERFGEMHARMWWEENRARIHEQYL